MMSIIGITPLLNQSRLSEFGMAPSNKDLGPLVHHEVDLPTNLGLWLSHPRTHALRAPKIGASKGSQTGSGRDFGSN